VNSAGQALSLDEAAAQLGEAQARLFGF